MRLKKDKIIELLDSLSDNYLEITEHIMNHDIDEIAKVCKKYNWYEPTIRKALYHIISTRATYLTIYYSKPKLLQDLKIKKSKLLSMKITLQNEGILYDYVGSEIKHNTQQAKKIIRELVITSKIPSQFRADIMSAVDSFYDTFPKIVNAKKYVAEIIAILSIHLITQIPTKALIEMYNWEDKESLRRSLYRAMDRSKLYQQLSSKNVFIHHSLDLHL